MSSWADIAAKNAPPEELQAHPDPSLLEKKEDHPTHQGEQAVDYEAEHVHVVDQDEARKLREAMQHADESHIEDDFNQARQHKQQRDQQAQQQRLKQQTQQELKHEVDKVEPVVTQVETKGKEVEDKVQEGKKEVKETYAEGKKEVKEKTQEVKQDVKEKYNEGKKEVEEKYHQGKKVAEKKWEQGKETAKEVADKVEREAKKDAKKVQKKAGEVEKEGRALAREYPYAASGIVGAINVALVAVPAYYAYSNWHKPRWDRRIVSAIAVGLTAAFGAESALGWFEYKEGHRPNL